MSTSASDLSSPQYGYDCVAAVTQASIDSTVKAFIASLRELIVSLCYVDDGNGVPMMMPYEAFAPRARGTDPFSVPNGADPNSADVQNLVEADFVAGFRAKIGIPPVQDPTSLPAVVTLGANTNSVQFNIVPLQRPTPFDWTWLEPSDLNTRDGILAINRNWLRNYFNQQLRDYIPNVCFQVDAHCDADMFSCQMSANCSPGQQPNLSQVSGATVLSYDYTSSSSDEAGVNGDLGSLAISTTYNMVIQFTTLNGNPSIVITQNLLISCNMRRDFTQTESNLVNETIVDTYTLSVDNDGTLGASLTTNSIDNSTNNFTNSSEPFTNLGDMVNNIRNLGRALTSTNVHNIPFSDIHKYVFPGGQKFAFKDVQFSENQDLVASITYLDPSAPPPTVHSNSTG
ncbi:hypothetical protein ACHAPQ_010289 [Fusarium lateritium]